MTDTRPKIGLALGGGGARGLAHIGVLKVLAREQIPIDMLAGTSMGGIIGALLAAGMPLAELESEALKRGKINEAMKLIDLRPTRRGLLSGNRVRHLLKEKIGEERTFEQLSIPLAVVAVDTLSGREITLKTGLVVEAVRATMSVPGIFVPVHIDNLQLVDGGVLNNVPVDVVRDLGAEKVIAVDVLPNFRLNEPGQPPVVSGLAPRHAPRAYRELWHIQMVMIAALTDFRLRVTRPDVLLSPEVPNDIDVLIGFDRPQAAIEAGERAAEAAVPQLRALLS